MILSRLLTISSMKYTIFMVLASVISLMKNIVYAKVLGVSDFGSYTLIILVSSYLMFTISMGVDTGFLRNGSFLLGQNRFKDLNKLKNSTITYVIALFIVVGILVYLIGNIIGFSIDINKYAVLKYSGFYGGALLLFNIVITYVRILQKNELFSYFLFCKSFLFLLLGYVSCKYFGIVYTVIIESIIMTILSIIALLKVKYRFSIIDKASLIDMVKVGLPFSMSYIVKNLSMNFDKWTVTITLGVVSLGLYSFPMILLTVVTAIMNIINQAFVPKLIANYGCTNDYNKMIVSVNKIILYLSILAIPSGVLTILFSKYILNLYFPDYIDTVELIPFVVIGVIFHLLNLYEFILIAIKKGKDLLYAEILLLIIFGIGCVFGYLYEFEIIYYAILFCLNRCFSFFINRYIVTKYKK